MSDNNKSKTRDLDDIMFPDMIELWKKIYFKSEEAYANLGKEIVSSNSFVQMLDQVRDQYLSNYKLSSQNLDKFFEVNPIASKKDIARIAELVIALEDKLDNLDLQFSDNLNSMVKSLVKLVDFQQSLKNENALLRQEILTLISKLDQINKALQTLPVEKAGTDTAAKKKSKSKNASANANTDEGPDSID
jgi:polyhydroxyalkanoic acid synthase PhaR subunit